MKKKKFIKLFFIMNLLITYSLHVSSQTLQMELIWAKPFFEDTSSALLINDPLPFQDYIIYSNRLSEDSNHLPTLRILHKQTGKEHPTWNLHRQRFMDSEISNRCLQINPYSDVIFSTSTKKFFATHIENGKRLWVIDFSPYEADHQFTMLENCPLISYNYSMINNQWSKIAKILPKTGEIIDLLNLKQNELYEPLIMPIHVAPYQGDTLLLFLSSAWNFEESSGKITAYCYSLQQQQLLWQNDTFTTDQDASYQHPIVIGNTVIYCTLHSLYGLNITNGTVLWRHEENETFVSSPLLQDKNKLFIRSESGHLFCLNADQGNLIWKNDNCLPAGIGNMEYYNQHLWMTATNQKKQQGVLCISAETGETKWFNRGNKHTINRGLYIDKENALLFCSNSYWLMCYKIK
jgi:hypothetical protein